jgi:predicted nucleotide-binding protein
VTPVKPTLFIGSSRQRLAVARGLQRLLGDVADVTVWDEAPQFAINDAILDGLIKVGETFDFALLVFGQDDCTMMGSDVVATVRDNVIFELGLFMGRLGKGRALWVSPSGPKAPHLASDLGGIVHLEIYEPNLTDDAAIEQALAATVDKVRRHIVSLGHRTDLTANVVPMRHALCLASSQYSQARFQEDIAYHVRFAEVWRTAGSVY